jgi:hypothetical protein
LYVAQALAGLNFPFPTSSLIKPLAYDEVRQPYGQVSDGHGLKPDRLELAVLGLMISGPNQP